MSQRKKDVSSQSFPDLMATLIRKVGGTGKVNECYGGVCIEVTDPVAFPWGDIVQELLNVQEEVWLRKKKGKMEIVSKPGMP